MNKIVFSIFLLLTPIITIAQNPIITKFENGKFYKFVNVNSKHYLGAANYEQVEGNDFRQFEDGGQANIQWRIENQPNNNFIIKSTDEKSCIAIEGEEPNQIVSLVNFNAANGQKWVFEPQANGQVKIKNVLTNKYIGVPDGSFAENAKVALSENTVENLLLWQIQEVLPIDHKVAVAIGNYLFKNVNSNAFIFPTENAIEGSELLQSKEKTAINIFKLEQQKDGTYLIISNENNYCFDAENTNSSPVLSKPSNKKSLYWILTPKSKNTYNIKSLHTGQILSVKDGLRTDKAALTLTSIKNENANYTQWIILNSDGTEMVNKDTKNPVSVIPSSENIIQNKIANGIYSIRKNKTEEFLTIKDDGSYRKDIKLKRPDNFLKRQQFKILISNDGQTTISLPGRDSRITLLYKIGAQKNIGMGYVESNNTSSFKLISLGLNKYKIESILEPGYFLTSYKNDDIFMKKSETDVEYNQIWELDLVDTSLKNILYKEIQILETKTQNINAAKKMSTCPDEIVGVSMCSQYLNTFIISARSDGTAMIEEVQPNGSLMPKKIGFNGIAENNKQINAAPILQNTIWKLISLGDDNYKIQSKYNPEYYITLVNSELVQLMKDTISANLNQVWNIKTLRNFYASEPVINTPPQENISNNILANGVYFFSPEKQPNMFLTYYSTYPETFTFSGKVERNNATKNQALEIKNFSNGVLMISKPDDITKSLSYENFDLKASLRLLNFFIDTANVNALWSLIPLGENKFKIKSVREPEKYLTYHGENNTLFEVTNNPSYNQIWIIKSTVNNAINNNQTLPTALIGLNGKYQITSKTSNKKLALIKNGNTNKLGTTNIINTGITTKIDIATTNEIGTLSALNLFITVKKNANQLPTNINLGSTLENWKFIKIENNKYKIESINNPGYFLTEEISTGTGLIVSMKATTDKKYCQIWNLSKL